MKILLAAVNAKYIHSNLAVYSLKAYAEDPAVEIGEYTINQQKDDILMDIYKRKPDILCLSCYIWNLDYIEEIVLEIGKLRPDMPIWLGGPEVSYDAQDVLRRLPCVKGVMKGEGEKTFKEICRIYRNEFEKEKENVDNSWTTKNSGGKLSAKSIWANFVQKAKAAWTFSQKKFAGKSASEQYMIAGGCVALVILIVSLIVVLIRRRR